jgi:hypothetical protein
VTKLTLSIDESVVRRAKRYAETRGTSVSRLVETYLDAVSGSAKRKPADSPSLRRLRGMLRAPADREAYSKHLSEKYR